MFFILGFLNIIKNYPCKHVFSHSAWHTKKTIPSVKHIFQKNYILRTPKNEKPKNWEPKKMYACNRGIGSKHFERNHSLAFQMYIVNGPLQEIIFFRTRRNL